MNELIEDTRKIIKETEEAIRKHGHSFSLFLSLNSLKHRLEDLEERLTNEEIEMARNISS